MAVLVVVPAHAHHPATQMREKHLRAAQMERVSRDAERWDRVRHWREVRVTVKRERVRALREHRNCAGGGSVAANRRLGRCLAARRGWVGAQWRCLDTLWGGRESGWNHRADNPHSSAYGIPQALPGSKMGAGWQHNPRVQIVWGLGYIAGRYGSPCAALGHHNSHGWY